MAEVRSALAPQLTPRPYGLAAGTFPVPDEFDAGLPADVLRDFEGR